MKLNSTSEELQKKKEYIESVEPQLAHGGDAVCSYDVMLVYRFSDDAAILIIDETESI